MEWWRADPSAGIGEVTVRWQQESGGQLQGERFKTDENVAMRGTAGILIAMVLQRMLPDHIGGHIVARCVVRSTQRTEQAVLVPLPLSPLTWLTGRFGEGRASAHHQFYSNSRCRWLAYFTCVALHLARVRRASAKACSALVAGAPTVDKRKSFCLRLFRRQQLKVREFRCKFPSIPTCFAAGCRSGLRLETRVAFFNLWSMILVWR